MAVTADSVVIELLAKTDGYTSNINGAATATTNAMSKIEQSATRAENQIVRSTGAIANAQRNLGRQIADVGTQLNSGQSPFLIIAQQAPQVADALADMGGRGARVAQFFAGPWGAALLAAGSALGLLLEQVMRTGEGVDALVRKLQEVAEKTRLTAEAQRIFETTAEGAADAVDKMNDSLGKANITQEQAIRLDLARARSLREVAIRALTAAEAAARASITEARIAEGNASPGFGANADEQIALERERERAVDKRTAAEKALKDAQQARANAEKAVANAAIPLLDNQAAAATDKSTAATLRHEKALGRLRDAYISASIAAKTNEQREAATRAYREGRTRIDSTLAAEQKAIQEDERKGRRGPSAETLARRAEANRVREVRNNEAYNNELETLNQAIIQASRAQEVDAGKLAEFSRQEVASALAKRNAQIDADESAKRYSREQADNLRKLAAQAAEIQNLNISNEEVRRRTDEQRAIAQTRLGVEGDQLQAQISISESLKERRQLERQLLDVRFKQLQIEQDAILNDTTGRYTDAQRTQAKITRDSLPALRAAGETAIDQRNRSPYDAYRRSIEGIDNLQLSLDAVKVDALEAVTDELTNATTAALGLKGAFGQIVGELIRIGIQRTLIGPLADTLFGAAGGGAVSTGGGFIGRLFGRASGGYMAPGSIARVNEGRSTGVELLRMGAQGGTVIPLGQAAAPARDGNTTVHQHFTLDARYGITTPELLAGVQSYVDGKAAQAVNTSTALSRKGMPAAQARFGQLGTT